MRTAADTAAPARGALNGSYLRLSGTVATGIGNAADVTVITSPTTVTMTPGRLYIVDVGVPMAPSTVPMDALIKVKRAGVTLCEKIHPMDLVAWSRASFAFPVTVTAQDVSTWTVTVLRYSTSGTVDVGAFSNHPLSLVFTDEGSASRVTVVP